MTGAGVAPAPLRALLTPEAVRERCGELWNQAEADSLEHFRLDPLGLDEAVRRVAEEIERNYPDGPVPLHSRWRHFELDGRDLWLELAAADAERDGEGSPRDPHRHARSQFDLAIVSVLLDAGAGPDWRYRDGATGVELGRSEGLALASLRMFGAGLLSDAGAADPLRADAAALAALEPGALAEAMQSRADNPLLGVDQRCELLRRLGATLSGQPAVFARDGAVRPGHLYDRLRARAADGVLQAREILIALLECLGDIWPNGQDLGGIRVGDVGRHRGIRRDDASNALVPFHKLSQWLAYSLVEPLEAAGVRVVGLDGLTGLPEYRNGGLLIDCGALMLRDGAAFERAHAPTDELVVEWRALTVVALDRIAGRVRERLGRDAVELPLGAVLQGGSWSAGRRVAAERRPGGAPPLTLISDGTLF